MKGDRKEGSKGRKRAAMPEHESASTRRKRPDTQHMERDFRLFHANRALRMLSECNEAVLRSKEESDLLANICGIIVKVGGYRAAWVGYALEDPDKTVHPVAQAGFENRAAGPMKASWGDDELGNGPTGASIKTGKPCVVQNAVSNRSFSPWKSDATKSGLASCAALPLTNETRVFGALNIFSVEPEAFNEEEVALLANMANNLAYGVTALHHDARRKQAEQALEASELEKALKEIALNRGVLYDPQVVDSCLRLFGEKGFSLD